MVEVAKVSSQAISQGAPVYWDNTAKLFTTVSMSNTLARVCVVAAGNPSSTVKLRLNGSFS